MSELLTDRLIIQLVLGLAAAMLGEVAAGLLGSFGAVIRIALDIAFFGLVVLATIEMWLRAIVRIKGRVNGLRR